MMPDLDRYAGTVLGAYGVTLLLLALLILVSLRRAARVKRALARIEAQAKRRSHGKA
ncbi:MAG TPA: heme exporter protein CcmD [Amaricoccus sp.]|uniref:heme exporter protein CcmD n=1 Tax=Amaricoccus sp. TaxID=1872485 RepID=UPI002D15C58D|nr:heme exporter protein CcmD [Amaricoccus sp.]HMQ94134.1 heme exporter protein CcmD [Amaricoccus sp.]HMR53755.1 heme exporter protein CcmD [Amaricoccus sp.]HMR61887.1 heme exporter protein CcmD [Amaricoccus sp.]HMU00511.1 heme exporter protein CcmD [Amaricoccus sp.]